MVVVVVGAAVVVVGAMVVVVGAAVVLVGAMVVVGAAVVVVGFGFLALVRTTRTEWQRADPLGAGPQTGRCSTLWPRWSGGGGPCGSAPANVAWPRPTTRAAPAEMTTTSAERRARMKRLLGEERGTASAILDGDSDHHKTRIPDNPARGRQRAIQLTWEAVYGMKGNARDAPT